jgi:serine/threonine protein kinase
MITDKIIHGTRRTQGEGGDNDMVKHEQQNMLNSENVINNTRRGVKRECYDRGLTIRGDGRSASSGNSNIYSAGSPNDRTRKRTKMEGNKTTSPVSATHNPSLIFEFINYSSNYSTGIFSESRDRLFLRTLENNTASDHLLIGFKLDPDFFISENNNSNTINICNRIKFCVETENSETRTLPIIYEKTSRENTIVARLQEAYYAGALFVYIDDYKFDLYFKSRTGIKLTGKISFKDAGMFCKLYNLANEFEKENYIVNYNNELGHGGEGIVYECFNLANGFKFVVKRFFVDGVGNHALKVQRLETVSRFQSQIATGSNKAPHVYGFFKDAHGIHFKIEIDDFDKENKNKVVKLVDGSVHEVHEFISGNSMFDVVENDLFGWYVRDAHTSSKWNGKYIRKQQIDKLNSIVKQVLEISIFLRQNNIAHRDLSPENFMLQPIPDGYLNVIIIDFGHAIDRLTRLDGPSGKIYYIAPEVYENMNQRKHVMSFRESMRAYDQYFKPENRIVGTGKYSKYEIPIIPYDYRADYFSIGQTLFTLVFGRIPIMNEIDRELFLLHAITNYPHLTSVCNIISGLLIRNPDQRWTSEIALKHFITKLHGDDPVLNTSESCALKSEIVLQGHKECEELANNVELGRFYNDAEGFLNDEAYLENEVC